MEKMSLLILHCVVAKTKNVSNLNCFIFFLRVMLTAAAPLLKSAEKWKRRKKEKHTHIEI